MVDIDVRQPNIQGNAAIQATGNASAVQATSPATVDVTQATSSDSISTGNTQNTQNTTKRNVEELYQHLKGICAQNGIDFNKVKQMGLLSSVSGKTEEELLNAEQAEINKLVKLIEETIAAMKEDKIELTAENLEKQARGYQIQLDAGWDSISSFRKANKKNSESVIQRLNRFFGCDFEKLSTEQKAEKLDAYFSRYFDENLKTKLKNAKTPEEANKIKAQVAETQLTDFSKLLYNSSNEEKEILRDAIEYLCNKNRQKGYESILRTFNNATQRTAFADKTTHKMVQTWQTKVDQFGDTPDADPSFTVLVLKDKSETGLRSYHKDAQNARETFFTEENKAKIEEIKTKISNGEKLTEEEQSLLQEEKFHTADSAGEFVGVGNNTVVSDDVKSEMLHELNKDAYDIPNYREVLNEVNKLIEEHPEILNMPKDKFIEELDKATNGNFSRVMSDIANGTTSELKAPSVLSKPTSADPTSVQVTESDVQASLEAIKAINLKIEEQSKAQVGKSGKTESAEYNVKDIKSCSKTLKGCAAYIKEHGLFKFLKDLCKTQNNNDRTNKIMAGVFELLPDNLQSLTLSQNNANVIRNFMDKASTNALRNSKGISYEATNVINEELEKREKADKMLG